ncbi:MAG: hypothetical protein ABR923_12570 [Terracidiphilus sp.]|jgi:hypothetical protein
MRKSLFALLFLAVCTALLAQQALNNDAIIKLVKAGLSDDLILSTIGAQPGTYDTSTDGLIALKSAGVSDRVVAAVVAKAAAALTPVPKPIPQPEITAAESKQYHGQVSPGSRIVIAPMGGFETYFAAAIREKGVPVTLTLDRDSAQYFVVSTETEWRGFVAGSAAAANWSPSGGTYGSASSASSTRGLESSIMLIDAKTKDVVWAYEVHKSSHGALIFGTLAARGQQSLAEACAKHLKEFMEKGK